MENKNLKENEGLKKRLRKIGSICLSIGVFLIIIGFIDIFSSMGGF